ncbi:MAG: excinuclease ABC subunit UvrA, partial [Patescibacteria group bacterium]
SPIVRDRKGEYSGLLDNLRGKGLTRARIDGLIVDLFSDLTLIKTNKHTIEAVIDRVSISKKDLRDSIAAANLKTRLTEAVEQAASLSEGLVIISQIGDPGFEFPEHPKSFTDHLFSEKFSCPLDNISLSEIEPRSFSFNSPHGACPTCSGIGLLLKIDPELVFNPNLTISEGGILPYAKMFFHETWYSRVVAKVCNENKIPMRETLKSLTSEAKKILLFGTGERVYAVTGENRFGKVTQIHEPFTGIVADLETRHQQSESEFVRTEIEKFMRKEICPTCQGARLKPESLTITIIDQSIIKITDLPITGALAWIQELSSQISEREKSIASMIIKEISGRLAFLKQVGLEYLTLSRAAATLSGGEAQRIRLASQIGSGLSGVLYVLDEPSIGLHPRDNQKLITTLKSLRDLGNTVVVVEHDREVMEESDWIFDFGPGAGSEGGKIVFLGTVGELKKDKRSQTGSFLNDVHKISFPGRLVGDGKVLTLEGASGNNLKNITVDFPLSHFICVTGVSGSGKSTLVVETLYHGLMKHFYPYHREKPAPFQKIAGLEHIDKVILIDQSPIGRTPRSNPATYTGLFGHIRDLFASLPEARVRGYRPGRFSFNVKGGRCEACEGEGQIKIEMQFLADVYITCEVCHGRRYNSETLEVHYKGKSIADVLDMSVLSAKEFFTHIPPLATKLSTLEQVGLTYIHIG